MRWTPATFLLLREVCNCFQLLRDLLRKKRKCHVFIENRQHLSKTLNLSEMVLVKLSAPLITSPKIPQSPPSFPISSASIHFSYMYCRTYEVVFQHLYCSSILHPESLHTEIRPPTTQNCWRRSEHLLCCLHVPTETKSDPKAQAQLLGSGSAASGPRDVFITICSGLDTFGNAVPVTVNAFTDNHQCASIEAELQMFYQFSVFAVNLGSVWPSKNSLASSAYQQSIPSRRCRTHSLILAVKHTLRSLKWNELLLFLQRYRW